MASCLSKQKKKQSRENFFPTFQLPSPWFLMAQGKENCLMMRLMLIVCATFSFFMFRTMISRNILPPSFTAVFIERKKMTTKERNGANWWLLMLHACKFYEGVCYLGRNRRGAKLWTKESSSSSCNLNFRPSPDSTAAIVVFLSRITWKEISLLRVTRECRIRNNKIASELKRSMILWWIISSCFYCSGLIDYLCVLGYVQEFCYKKLEKLLKSFFFNFIQQNTSK